MPSWIGHLVSSVLLYLLLNSSLVSASESRQGNAAGLISCLENIANLDVVLPSDESTYANKTSPWELKIPPQSPVAVIVPTSRQQIQSAVKCAAAANIKVVPKSGGHSYEGWSVQDNTLAVDLMAMDTVSVNKSTGIITADGGATLGTIYYRAWFDAGMGFNAGTCPNVGISGFLLGGGFGYHSRRAGMGCDNVVSFEMVTAKGGVIWASKDDNSHIYWSMCGAGGGNFGIVTKWNIQMMEVPEVIQYASIQYKHSVDTAARVMTYFQDWASQVDEDLGSEVHVGPVKTAANLFFYYAGEGSLQSIIEESELLGLNGNTPPVVKYQNFTWIESVMAQAGWGLKSPEQILLRHWPERRSYRKQKTYYVFSPGWEKDLYKKLLEQMKEMFASGGKIKFRTGGGRISSLSSSETAFPYRDALGFIITKGQWNDTRGSTEEQAYAWLEAASTTIREAGEGSASYINYIDRTLENWQEAYYGSNYKRLQAIKSMIDPTDMFTYPIQGIKGL